MPVPRTALEVPLKDLYDYIDTGSVNNTSAIASGSAVALTTNTTANITSLTLPAGKYDIFGVVGFLPAASTSITRLSGGESETSATDAATGKGFNITLASVVPGAVGQELSIPYQRVTFAVPTTVYLVVKAVFTVSTMGAYGTLTAIQLKA